MKDIEKIIRKNKTAFDNEEPGDGHFDRFEEKLKLRFNQKKQQTMKTKKFEYKTFLRIAAIALVLIVAGMMVFEKTQTTGTEHQQAAISLKDVSPEYEEVEMYYQQTVDKKLNELQNIQCNKTDMASEDIIQELSDIDTMYNSLQQELMQNKNDERIINAMINCYQMKVEVLDQIINRVNENC